MAPDVERVARAQHRDAERPAQRARGWPGSPRAASRTRGPSSFEARRRSPARRARPGAWSPGSSRIGTGMNTPTNTTTINQNSARRLRGSGSSSTGGWFTPPDIRRMSADQQEPDQPGQSRRSSRSSAPSGRIASAFARLVAARRAAPRRRRRSRTIGRSRCRRSREAVVAVAEVGGRDVPAVELSDRQQVDHRDQQAGPAGLRRRVQEDVALAVGQPGALDQRA